MTDFTSSADRALSELGGLIGIPSLKFDPAGCCQLVFDQHHLVTLIRVPVGQRLVLSCPLLAVGDILPLAGLEAMLRANFMGGGCAGGSFGMTPDGRPCLQLSQAFTELAGQTLLARIDTLLQQVDHWSERLFRGEGRTTEHNGRHRISSGAGEGERPPNWLLDRA